MKSLFYIPSVANGVCIDVSFIDYKDGNKVIDGIYFEGDNILYDETGNEYFDPIEYEYLRKTTSEELKEELSYSLITPSYRLTVNFINVKDDKEILLAPYPINIRRLAN